MRALIEAPASRDNALSHRACFARPACALVRLGPMLHALVVSLGAVGVLVAVPLAPRAAVVDAVAQIGWLLEDGQDRLHREAAAA